MAIIQKLRNSGAVVIAIIVALVLFVIGDILTGNKYSGLTANDQDVVGAIFTEKIHEPELRQIASEIFQRQSQNPNFKVDENTEKQMFDQAWTSMIRKKTLEAQIAKAGIFISDEELNEMILGDYPEEAFKQEQAFQSDGKYDPVKVKGFFDQGKTNPQLKAQLLEFVNQTKDRALEQRYARYVSKCIVTPKNERGFSYVVANQGVEGKLVALNFNTILDKDVKVTREDLEKYLNAHKEEYKQAYESRDISYVNWDITPSSADSAYAKSESQRIYKSMLAVTKPDTAGDGAEAFTYFRALGADSVEKAWYSPLRSMPVGGVLNPYYKDGKYTIVQKIDEQKDTANADGYVKCAHVLIPLTGELPNKRKIADSVEAKKLADEIMAKIKGGADVSALAKDFSSDPGVKENKGIYDWALASGYMPDFGKFCLTHKAGEVGIVKVVSERYSGYHVIKVLADPETTKVRIRKKIVEVTPGPETIKAVTLQSRDFRNKIQPGNAKSFDTERDRIGKDPKIRKGIKTEDRNLPGFEDANDVKSVLYWLFDNERQNNDISDVFAFNKLHVVIMVTNVRHAGYAKVDDVKEKIEPLVRNELKAKKLEAKFNEALKSAKTPEELAQKTGGSLIQLEGLKMGGNFIPQLYTEPKILGAIFGVKEKVLSKPVSGINATAVIWVEKRDKVEVPKTLEETMDFMNQPQFMANRITEVLRQASEIQDFRYKFSWN